LFASRYLDKKAIYISIIYYSRHSPGTDYTWILNKLKSVSPSSIVHLEKLIAVNLVNKFCAFCEIRTFITIMTCVLWNVTLCAHWKLFEVSEEHVASIFRVKL
jgi:hypothetical protein